MLSFVSKRKVKIHEKKLFSYGGEHFDSIKKRWCLFRFVYFFFGTYLYEDVLNLAILKLLTFIS